MAYDRALELSPYDPRAREIGWHVYTARDGRKWLTYYFANRRTKTAPCPGCGRPMSFGPPPYRAECCGEAFRSGFGYASRVRPA